MFLDALSRREVEVKKKRGHPQGEFRADYAPHRLDGTCPAYDQITAGNLQPGGKNGWGVDPDFGKRNFGPFYAMQSSELIPIVGPRDLPGGRRRA